MMSDVASWARMLASSRDLIGSGAPRAAAKAFRDWCAAVQATGEAANLGKCAAWTSSPASFGAAEALLPAGFLREGDAAARVLPGAAPLRGVKVLGFPLGHEDFCSAFYAHKASKTALLVDRKQQRGHGDRRRGG